MSHQVTDNQSQRRGNIWKQNHAMILASGQEQIKYTFHKINNKSLRMLKLTAKETLLTQCLAHQFSSQLFVKTASRRTFKRCGPELRSDTPHHVRVMEDFSRSGLKSSLSCAYIGWLALEWRRPTGVRGARFDMLDFAKLIQMGRNMLIADADTISQDHYMCFHMECCNPCILRSLKLSCINWIYWII